MSQVLPGRYEEKPITKYSDASPVMATPMLLSGAVLLISSGIHMFNGVKLASRTRYRSDRVKGIVLIILSLLVAASTWAYILLSIPWFQRFASVNREYTKTKDAMAEEGFETCFKRTSDGLEEIPCA